MTAATALALIIAIAPPGKAAQPKRRAAQEATVAARPDRKPGVSRIILVRHCEKSTGETDPGLTAKGEARALALAQALEEETVDVIYSTPYRRTQATVKPLASARNLDVAIIQGTNDAAFARHLLEDHKGQSVVIASHINVIPELVKLLGVRERVTLDEGAYGDMFIVDVDPRGRSTLIRSRFGE